MPPVVSRDKSSIREAAGSTVGVTKGKTGEDEVALEEEECRDQTVVSLNKRKRAKKSPVLGSPSKGKRPGSFPLAWGIQDVSINSAPALSVSFFTYTCNPQEASDVSYESNEEEVRRKKQKLKKSFAPKMGISSRKKITLDTQHIHKGSDIPVSLSNWRSLQLSISWSPKLVVGPLESSLLRKCLRLRAPL